MYPSDFVALYQLEFTMRLTAFMAILCLMLLWEFRAPRRPRIEPTLTHDLRNLMLVAVNSVTLRLLAPLLPITAALLASHHDWGLFNLITLPMPLAAILSFIALDLVVYWQHVVFHRVPWLWRIHRVHHLDLDFTATTGLRFHPLEIILSLAIKLAAIALLGPPVVAVIAFEIVLNGAALFNHGNVSLHPRLEKLLRTLIVTPDMHRVHHSTLVEETDSNFGFNLSVWDKIFRTYRDQPKHGHDAMAIGLAEEQLPKNLSLLKILVLPFKRASSPSDS